MTEVCESDATLTLVIARSDKRFTRVLDGTASGRSGAPRRRRN